METISKELVLKFLKTIYNNYLLDMTVYQHISYKAKCLGAMEGLLVILGVLGAGQPLPYKKSKHKQKILWMYTFEYDKSETYPELIIRLVRETLEIK